MKQKTLFTMMDIYDFHSEKNMLEKKSYIKKNAILYNFVPY